MNLLTPALKNALRRQVARLLAHLLGRPVSPNPPRAINCKFITLDAGGELHWVEREEDTPAGGSVYVRTWHCATTTWDKDGILLVPLTPMYFTLKKAEALQRRLSLALAGVSIQGSSLVFDAGDPNERRMLDECRRKAAVEAMRYG